MVASFLDLRLIHQSSIMHYLVASPWCPPHREPGGFIQMLMQTSSSPPGYGAEEFWQIPYPLGATITIYPVIHIPSCRAWLQALMLVLPTGFHQLARISGYKGSSLSQFAVPNLTLFKMYLLTFFENFFKPVLQHRFYTDWFGLTLTVFYTVKSAICFKYVKYFYQILSTNSLKKSMGISLKNLFVHFWVKGVYRPFPCPKNSYF